jgi:hypothetical protein
MGAAQEGPGIDASVNDEIDVRNIADVSRALEN